MTDQVQKTRPQSTEPRTKTQKTTSADDKKQPLRQVSEELTGGTPSDLFADVNVTMKSGHLTRDAETIGEGKYVKVRIATNKQYEKDGEVKTNTNYFEAMISHHLKDTFDVAKDFKKGDWIYLKGEDSTRSFDTPEGYRKTATTIFAYHVALKKEKSKVSLEPEAQSQEGQTHGSMAIPE